MPKLLKPYVRVGKGTFKGLFPKGKTPNCKITYAGEFGLFRLQHNRVKDIDHSCFPPLSSRGNNGNENCQ